MVTVPTLEYHNRNWTWADMLMEVKKVYKQHIIQKVSVVALVPDIMVRHWTFSDQNHSDCLNNFGQNIQTKIMI